MSRKTKKTVRKGKKRKRSGGKGPIRTVIIIAIVMFAAAFTIYRIYDADRMKLSTKTALEETISETIDADAFIVRNESYIKGSAAGALVQLISDGERVTENGKIAIAFSSESGASDYVRMQALQKEYERYAALTNQGQYASLKVGALKTKTKTEFCAFLSEVDNGNIPEALKNVESFRDSKTTLQIATEGTLDLGEKMKAVMSEISSLRSSAGSYSPILTGSDSAGYYISTADGFENTLSYEDAESFTPTDILNALSSSPENVDSYKLGKLMTDYRWYIACVTEDKKIGEASVGEKMTIRFPESEAGSVSVRVVAKNRDKDGKTAVVFRCSEVNGTLMHLRREKIQIILDEHTGFIVENKAVRIRELDGKKVRGVYVLAGNVVKFKKIEDIYEGDGFVMSATSQSENYIRIYDEIITEGRDLYDGKIVYR
ncbi:MAG: hypothetical protein K6F09_00840 [Clostridiales bacterium]|nr:hypothetical protein [Clostridiales bacterium]